MEWRDLLAPIGWAYGAGMDCRNWLFDSGLWAQEKLSCPVISVGNLTAGGTGKTPFIELLARTLQGRGWRVGLVSRGYGGIYQNEVEVVAEGASEVFGDEPLMLAQHLRDVPIVLGRERVKAAKFLLARHQVDLILMDDGFQHRHMARDLDILVFDSSQPVEKLRPLPWGMGREFTKNVNRAGLLVLSKVNLTTADLLKRWRLALSEIVPAGQWLEVAYELGTVRSLDGRLLENVESRESGASAPKWDPSAVTLWSGVGNPASFKRAVQTQYKVYVQNEIVARDHQPLDNNYLDKVAPQIEEAKCILVTEKDAVRMKDLKPNWREKIFIAPLELNILAGEELLKNALYRLAL